MVNQIVASALLCLSQTAYMEARSEPIQAQIATMYVLYRRANFQPELVCLEMAKPYQFTWYGRIKPPERNDPKLRPFYALAQQVYNLTQPDYSKGATNFHDTSISKPKKWKAIRVVQWEHLIFYKQEETKYVAKN